MKNLTLLPVELQIQQRKGNANQDSADYLLPLQLFMEYQSTGSRNHKNDSYAEGGESDHRRDSIQRLQKKQGGQKIGRAKGCAESQFFDADPFVSAVCQQQTQNHGSKESEEEKYIF